MVVMVPYDVSLIIPIGESLCPSSDTLILLSGVCPPLSTVVNKYGSVFMKSCTKTKQSAPS